MYDMILIACFIEGYFSIVYREYFTVVVFSSLLNKSPDSESKLRIESKRPIQL